MKLSFLWKNASKKTKIESDLQTEKFEEIFQWSETVYLKIKKKKMGPMRFELMTFRLSVERSSQSLTRAHEEISRQSHLSLIFFPLD